MSDLFSRQAPARTTMKRRPTEPLWTAPQMTQTQDSLRRRHKMSLPKSRRSQPRSPRGLNGSCSQPPRHYMTRERSAFSVKSCPLCLARFSCCTCCPLTIIQALKVRAVPSTLAAIPTPTSSVEASCSSPPSRTLNSWRPACRDRNGTLATLMTLFRQSFLSNTG